MHDDSACICGVTVADVCSWLKEIADPMAGDALRLIDDGVRDGELLMGERLRAKNAEVERDKALELLAEARDYIMCDCGRPTHGGANLAARIDALVESVEIAPAGAGKD
jgi:hypothetical protein